MHSHKNDDSKLYINTYSKTNNNISNILINRAFLPLINIGNKNTIEMILSADRNRSHVDYHLSATWENCEQYIKQDIYGNNTKQNDNNIKQVEKHILLLADQIEQELKHIKLNFTYFEQNNITQTTFNKCLKLLQKIELVICRSFSRSIHLTLPYFPRFLNVAIRVFQASIYAGIYNKDSEFIQSFYNRMYKYLEDIMQAAFNARRLKINIKQSGPNKEFTYLYDDHLNESLTKWIPFTKDIECELLELQELLRDKIADNYLKELPIEVITRALGLLSNNNSNMKRSTWENIRTLFLFSDDELDKKQGLHYNKGLMYSLALPTIRQKYLPEISNMSLFLPTFNNTEAYNNLSSIEKPYIQGLVSKYVTTLLEKTLSKTFVRILSFSALPALSPAIGVLINLIWPPEKPISLDEIDKEIDNKIKHALDDKQASEIKDKFKSLTNAYLLRMQDIENLNKGNPDQSKWDLGRPADWEAAVDSADELKEYFFNTTYAFEYQTHQIFPYFATMYFSLIYGKIMAARPGDSIEVERNMLREFFSGWYIFLKKLADQTWNGILGINDFSLIRRALGGPYYVREEYDAWQWVTDLTSYDTARAAAHMLDTRCRAFMIANSSLRSLCQSYDDIVRKHNSVFNESLPSNAITNIFDYIVGDKWYAGKMNRLAKANPDSSKVTWYDYLRSPLTGDFKRNDLFVRLESSDHNFYYYCCGDYALLDNCQNVRIIRVPRGFRVFLYKETNFTGYCSSYPVTSKNIYSFAINDTFKSMKVRLDFDFWFENPKTVNFGRVLNLKWNKETAEVGDIPLAEITTDYYPDPDNVGIEDFPE